MIKNNLVIRLKNMSIWLAKKIWNETVWTENLINIWCRLRCEKKSDFTESWFWIILLFTQSSCNINPLKQKLKSQNKRGKQHHGYFADYLSTFNFNYHVKMFKYCSILISLLSNFHDSSLIVQFILMGKGFKLVQQSWCIKCWRWNELIHLYTWV